MSRSIEQLKAIYKFANKRLEEKLQLRTKSLKAHIIEMDILRKENHRLKLEIADILENQICRHCYKYNKQPVTDSNDLSSPKTSDN